MKVRVKIFATLAQSISEDILAQHPDAKRPGTPIAIEFPKDITLAELIDHLGLPKDQVKVTFVNGRIRKLDYRLADGDDVGIFPAVGGG